MKKMTRFQFANKATKAMISAAKLPLREKSVKRAFEAAKDSANDAILDLEEKIDDLRQELYTADKSADKTEIVQSLVEARQEISDLRQALIIIDSEAEAMAEVVEVEEDEE